MVSDIMKGLGIAFVIAGLRDWYSYVPFVGPLVLANAMWVFLGLGIIFIILGFRN